MTTILTEIKGINDIIILLVVGVAAPVFRPFLRHVCVADFCSCALVLLCYRPRGPMLEPGKA